MFETNGKRDKNIFRVVIGVNLFCLICLVFYTCNRVFLTYISNQVLASQQEILYKSSDAGDEIWHNLSWSFCFVMILLMVAIQVTMDLEMFIILFGYLGPCENSIKRVQGWLKMSTWFLIVSCTIFTLSIFLKNQQSSTPSPTLLYLPKLNAIVITTLGVGGLILRFFLLYIGNRYLVWLQAREEEDSHPMRHFV